MTERTCRFCGCVDLQACVVGDEPCSWIAEDVCSNPVCDAALNEGLVDKIADELIVLPPVMKVDQSREEALTLICLVARMVGGHHITEELLAAQAVRADHE